MSAPIVQMLGVYDVMDMSYTFEPGINPGVCTLVAAVENVDFDQVVNASSLTILYDHEGAGTTFLHLPDCRVGQVSQSLSGEAYTVTIPVFDRRWRWQFSEIAGWYNRRKADASDTVLTGTEKTPQELVTLLLDALGESNYDVTAMPNDARPELKWDEYTLAAPELQRLCDLMGCRIVIQLSTGRVKLYREGVGFGLPYNIDLLQPSYGIVTPIAPREIYATSAPTWQDRLFELEAVALDTDGKYKPFGDSGLSYKLASGERFEQDGGNLDQLASTSGWTDTQVTKAMKAAAASVYRTYRIADNSYNTDGLDNIWQIEFLSNIGDKDEDDNYKAIEVVGSYYNENLAEVEDWNVFDGGVSLDAEKRIVQLSQPGFLLDDGGSHDGEMGPATLYLHCCCRYRLNTTFEYLRRSGTVALSLTPWTGLLGRLPITLDHLQPIVTWEYTEDTATSTGTSDNYSTIDAEIAYYAQAEKDKFLTTVSGAGSYRGLVLFELDGLRSYVQWSFGINRPMTTTIALNQRPNNYVLGYKEKVKVEAAAAKQKNEVTKLKARAR